MDGSLVDVDVNSCQSKIFFWSIHHIYMIGYCSVKQRSHEVAFLGLQRAQTSTLHLRQLVLRVKCFLIQVTVGGITAKKKEA